jgi:hypothetical protein
VGKAARPASANRPARASRVPARALVRTVTAGESLLAASIVSAGARPYLRSQRSTSQRGWLSRTERCSARSDSGGSGMDSTPATFRSTALTKPEARDSPSCFSPSTVSETAARRGTREKKIW